MRRAFNRVDKSVADVVLDVGDGVTVDHAFTSHLGSMAEEMPNVKLTLAEAEQLTPVDDHPRSVRRRTRRRPRAERHEDFDDDQGLDEIIARAAIVVPEQRPLSAFVHHNTLHHFEHLPFEQGVLAGARLLGSQPYQTEAAFGRHLENGRITTRDIDAVLDAEPTELGTPVFAGGPTHRSFRSWRLRQAFEIPTGQSLEWALSEEGIALGKCSPLINEARYAELEQIARASFEQPVAGLLQRLWQVFERASVPVALAKRRTTVRARDQIWERHGLDTDLAVHSLLIRFTSAFLDQGLAYWAMPGREHGMLHAFRALYGAGGETSDPTFHGLDAELRRQQTEAWSTNRTIAWTLGQLQVPHNQWQEVLQATLLSLRGWAGMVRHFELHPRSAPVNAVPARLSDYLAIQLTLDWIAAKNVRGTRPPRLHREPGQVRGHNPIIYEAHLLAQLSDVDPLLLLDVSNARSWLDACRRFNDLERRRIWHLAYEHHYRRVVLGALQAHIGDPHPTPARSTHQAVFCIDDREESLRRHLEATLPDIQTFGFAGFFGVAMEYQGLHDIRPRALCPGALKPKHLVREVAVDEQAREAHANLRARKGKAAHAFSVSSRTLLRGGLLSAGLGLTALVPLIGRSLFPRAAHRWLHDHQPHPTTRLALERAPDAPQENGLFVGFTVSEMADVVHGALTTLGLIANLSPIVLIVGHGSSSVNNPHQSAYDCGATGGGRGGPNARAFAAMANHPGVRPELARRGTPLPDDTWFVGAMHDTALDNVTYFDLDLLPPITSQRFTPLQQALTKACELDAHERCRRFAHAPLDLDPLEAHCHVEGRAVDIGQPRPESGHAANAVCIVGRRERTRGLFLDRRAFLVSYDPTQDPTEEVLGNILQGVAPVGASINLEYYFSHVDPKHYGGGSKLPHNLVGLFAVMDGHSSDLRTGLPWQMVEIHEPVRLLLVVEARPDVLTRLLEKRPSLAPLVRNEWLRLVAMAPDSSELFLFERGEFRPYEPETSEVATFDTSIDVYRGKRGHLACARLAKPGTLEAL